MTKTTLIGLVLLLFISPAQAEFELPGYYGPLQWKTSKELRDGLFLALSGAHVAQNSGPDQVQKSCDLENESKCYSHKGLTYSEARRHMFGGIDLNGTSATNYSIHTYYCNEEFTNKDMGKFPLGPMKIPNTFVLNAEHTWPQSKFTSKFSKSLQKGDLHILLPVRSNVNSIRGNFPYGEVVTPTNTPCPEASLGRSAEGITVFEPSDENKGDVARALFYFSVRYKIAIDPVQENYLKKWHELDPVDAREKDRNEQAFAIQHNRNPFIDMPALVGQISNF